MIGTAVIWMMALGALYGFVQLVGDLVTSVSRFRRAFRGDRP